MKTMQAILNEKNAEILELKKKIKELEALLSASGGEKLEAETPVVTNKKPPANSPAARKRKAIIPIDEMAAALEEVKS